ncbi:MAG: DUF2225 domain-containing protein [Roseburia sp.]|nr:DUF2225 domain-containing protein [Roseburia sp.]
MNLFSGIEKFGYNVEKVDKELFKKTAKKPIKSLLPKSDAPQSEKDYLYNKRITCAVCQDPFEVKIVKSARLRRMQPDFDLRPRFHDIDPVKYDVYSCPHCGYTAMSRYFDHLTKGQINLIKTEICDNFVFPNEDEPETYDIETAIMRYKMSLFTSITKHARDSEKAYTCLKIAWLYRDLIKELPESTAEEMETKKAVEEMQKEFYKEAFEGFQQAISSEDFPICGMDSYTMDYLMACLAFHFKQYSYASKAISNILSSQTAQRRIKDKALDLKTYIVDAIKKETAKKQENA